MKHKPVCQLHRGLSLMEIILVMAILIGIAAMSFPMLQRSFSGHKLDKGADLVRSRMGRARVQAIRTGDVHAFYYQVKGAGYQVAPFSAKVVESLRRSSFDESQRTSNFDFGQDVLPQGVEFAAGTATLDSRSALTLSENNSVGGSLRPVLFYPDGTSQNAQIYLRSSDGDIVQVTLRGLTGTTTTKRITQ